ncbi:MAG: hypothetical protein HN742_41425 [Lentisphaerae bacterium]|mgnify:CR=1 FL=1|jgi:hypothetical protein|nr:hypothetical protein [Lentisphaerota bacterium]MBT4817468.1 hypothetical protein [Lentisphaerota bacterium]MBT5612749.1 hypothetical protein [Lentisphaerota bacterium]MBT7058978.1 hypothetical protein [Lentisphaerota bacterium]MBT7848398.1 hypothetical protein [Lentisphaerota bacterium]
MEHRQVKLSVAVAGLVVFMFWNMRCLEAGRNGDVTDAGPGGSRVPPTLALTTFALGPLRGLIVDALWWRMIQHQDEGNHFETMQLTEWITALQPRFPQVWAFHAWNLSYNVAHEFADPDTRWQWIQRSIRLLRDDGLRYNPGSLVIRKQLASIFLDRICRRGDPGQKFFQRNWALQVMLFLEDGSAEEIGRLRDAAVSAEELAKRPGVAALVSAGRTVGLDLTDFRVVLAGSTWTDGQKQACELPEHAPALRDLHQWARAQGVSVELGMNLGQMLRIDSEYGPFDWRLPQAHAVYWAAGETTFAEFASQGEQIQGTMIRQAMEEALHNGRLLYDSTSGFFMTTNNLQVVGRIHDYYDVLMQGDFSEHTDELHRAFLEEAIAVVYSFNHDAAARELFGHYVEDYPLPPGVTTFEAFVAAQMHRVVNARNFRETGSVVHAALFQAYFWLSTGDSQRAKGYARMAKLLWDRHQRRVAHAPERQLPPFDDMKAAARSRLLSREMAPVLRGRLKNAAAEIEVGAGDGHEVESVYLGEHAARGHGLKEKRLQADDRAREH